MIAGLSVLKAAADGILFRARGRRRRAAVLLNSPDWMAICFRLVDLLSHLQQHRGLSSAWLAGHRLFEAHMLSKRAEIDAVLADLARLDPAPWGGESRKLFEFRGRWRQLVGSIGGYSVERSFAQHSCLIDVVLHWLAACGERRMADDPHRRDATEAAANFFTRLPRLAECLAQARGIGAAVAARCCCSSVARVRLLLLIGRAESLLKQVGASDRDMELVVRCSVDAMAQLVRRKMLLSSGVSVSADAYFAATSRTIDVILNWARACGARLEGARTGRVAGACEPELYLRGG